MINSPLLDLLFNTTIKMKKSDEININFTMLLNIIQSEFLAAHHDYIEKFQVIELQQELTAIQTHLTRFLFSDCLEYM
ncbi:unnamed protein product [Rotaria sordida]|uniref:Uncharacterized protein n=2 Tax=Rotaria sordida TaxID=392033 RepID=A0A815FHB4_9BILA|nr:unnamed protein product [Rotaria sordida]CAF1587195.1 unnamed protein product [Rotaria sordida]